jgi:hypothetical protein
MTKSGGQNLITVPPWSRFPSRRPRALSRTRDREATHCGTLQIQWKLREKKAVLAELSRAERKSVGPKRCPRVATPWARQTALDRGRGGSLVSPAWRCGLN